MIRVTVFNEYRHEKESNAIHSVYPEGIHKCIGKFLAENSEIEVRHYATFDMEEHGLTEEVLCDTDVLVFWNHMLQEDFADEVAERVKNHVLNGMGLVALHSAHYSKILRKLLGTTMTLRWRDDDSERIVVTCPSHPIAEGIPERFDIPREEMYGEYFDIPKPDDVIFTGWFAGGEVFRSGCTFTRGNGRIFYFQPGHEEYPVYYMPIIQKIITNAVVWCNPKGARMERTNKEIRMDQAKISTFWDHIKEAEAQTHKDILTITKDIKAAGIDGVDIRLEQLKADEANISSILNEAGLGVSCIYEMYDWALNPDYTEAKEQVDKAAEYGAKVILVVPGFLPEDVACEFRKLSTRDDIWNYMDQSEMIQNIKNELVKLVDYAKTKGIIVTLEDFDGFTAPFARTEELYYFMKNVPGLKYTLDMGNFAYSDEDVSNAYGILQEYIEHVHCKDRGTEPNHEKYTFNKGLAASVTGSGYLPIRTLQKKVLSKGYKGYLATEHFGAEDQYRYIIESAKFLKEIM